MKNQFNIEHYGVLHGLPRSIGGVALFELIIICNYIVITFINSVKLSLTPCDSVVKKNQYENQNIQ